VRSFVDGILRQAGSLGCAASVYCAPSIVLLRYPFIWQAGKPALWRSAVRRPRSGL